MYERWKFHGVLSDLIQLRHVVAEELFDSDGTQYCLART